jgi:transposase
MAQLLVDDELWKLIAPLLPQRKRRRQHAGRRPLCDRKALSGILFVLRSGIPWNMLPQEMGCGSGMTCWRRLRTWQKARVWDRLHQVLLSQLRGADKLDFSRAIADSSSIRAVGAGKKVDRTQPIAVVRAANTISSRKHKASRLPSS